MTAVDIGANLGVYSLPLSRFVGKTGRIWAYEPGSEARNLLERSRVRNRADNLQILPAALSDTARDGHLKFGASSELNALGDDGPGERIQVSSMDIESAVHGWPSLDFVKIDAEGEEERILAGGRDLFERSSPLVLFEIKAGNEPNTRLREVFAGLGYRLFRQLGGAPILVPDDASQALDEYELNLFAAKEDRANAIAKEGLLVASMPHWHAKKADHEYAAHVWRSHPFAALIQSPEGVAMDPAVGDSIAGFAAWRAQSNPIGARCAALQFALHRARIAAAQVVSAARLSTLARIAWEWAPAQNASRRSGNCWFSRKAAPRNSTRRSGPPVRDMMASHQGRTRPSGFLAPRSSSLSTRRTSLPTFRIPRRSWTGSAIGHSEVMRCSVAGCCSRPAPDSTRRFQQFSGRNPT